MASTAEAFDALKAILEQHEQTKIDNLQLRQKREPNRVKRFNSSAPAVKYFETPSSMDRDQYPRIKRETTLFSRQSARADDSPPGAGNYYITPSSMLKEQSIRDGP